MCTIAIARADAAGAELLAEKALLARLQRRVIEAARVDRDLVPVPQRVRGRAEPAQRPNANDADVRAELEPRAQELALTAWRRILSEQARRGEPEQQTGHCASTR